MPEFTKTACKRWLVERLNPPSIIEVLTLAGMVLGLILEYIMGDKTLEAQWDELPDFLTNLILDGIGSEQS